MKQNITLSLDKELLTKIKVVAARRNLSVSGLLTHELTGLVHKDEHYLRCKSTAMQALEQGFHLGGRVVDRDELHER